MAEIARLTIKMSEVRAGLTLPDNSPLKALIDHALGQPTIKPKLDHAADCHVVYHSCGTCDDGGAMVEYYCSPGGNEPDYIVCESCG